MYCASKMSTLFVTLKMLVYQSKLKVKKLKYFVTHLSISYLQQLKNNFDKKHNTVAT